MDRTRARIIASIAVVSAVVLLGTAVASAADSEGRDLSDVRDASTAFHNLDIAISAGYGPVKGCAQKPGEGGMGQHYVKGELVGDPALDKLRPEALVFEPRAGGGYHLVALEYIVLKSAWEDANGSKLPRLFGKKLELVKAPNPYDLPDFYELHLWLWKANPSGLFADWNPNVSCRGLPF